MSIESYEERLLKTYNISPKKVNKMRSARIKRGLTQRDMARLLNVTQATYSRTEAWVTEASDDMLDKIAKILHTKRRDLYTKARID